MTQPPQDGFGDPRYPSGGQPPPLPPQPPPQQQQPQSPQPGYGYPSQQPQQPGAAPSYGYQSPYGHQPPGYGYPPPPPPPPGGSGSKGKLLAIIAGAVVAVLLIAGGVYFVVGHGDDGGDVAKPEATGSATSDPSSEPTDATTDVPTEDPADDPTFDSPSPHSQADGFKGQWQSDSGKTLTIGAELTSGKAAGKNSVSYIDPGGEGICMGIGAEQSGGSTFRMALSCGGKGSKKLIAGDSTQNGDSLTVNWDKGGSDTLAWSDGD